MTEDQWKRCTEPQKMLRFRACKASQRRFRLLAVACCRHLFSDVITDDRTRAALAVAERYADGSATKEELTAVRRAATAAREASWRARRAAWWTTYGRPSAAVRGVIDQPMPPPWRHDGLRAPKERPAPLARSTLAPLCSLVRDLLGNPFRPLAVIKPSLLRWNGGLVVQLAGAAYEERRLPESILDPARLAVLADALEESGFSDPDALFHLRGPGPHVRGCHVVDAILGKT